MTLCLIYKHKKIEFLGTEGLGLLQVFAQGSKFFQFLTVKMYLYWGVCYLYPRMIFFSSNFGHFLLKYTTIYRKVQNLTFVTPKWHWNSVNMTFEVKFFSWNIFVFSNLLISINNTTIFVKVQNVTFMTQKNLEMAFI